MKANELLSKPYALSFVSSSSWFRLAKTLDKSITITPTFDPLFSLTLQDSIIIKREFCVLWFFQKPVRYLKICFACIYLVAYTKNVFKKISKALEALSSFLKTGLISAIFIKFETLFF